MKQIIIYGVMATAVTLFIFAIFVGKQDNEKESKLISEQDTQAIRKYSTTNKDEKPIEETNKSLGETTNEELDKAKEKELNEIAKKVEKNPKLLDMFSEQDLAATKTMAKEFVTKFHAYDRSQPFAHRKAVLDMVSPTIHMFLIENKQKTVKGVIDVTGIKERKVLSVEIIEPENPGYLNIIWNATVKSKVTTDNGDERVVTDTYNLLFNQPSDDSYYIQEFYLIDKSTEKGVNGTE